ncbi:MAG: TspO/MBR family protein [Patescibacteria group bacterium]
MKRSDIIKLLVAIIVSEGAGIIGSIFTTPSIPTWYASLMKPALNPPSWVFAPVWTTLFALMGIAAFLVWRKGTERKDVRAALSVFGIQLCLNTLWSILFFGLHDPFASLIEIAALWLAIISTIFVFHRISRTAAYLLVPYLLWVSFASYLNYALWALNH